jgi:Tol biopolymer transport system component
MPMTPSALSRVVLLPLLALPATAQVLKLNGPLARGVAGEVSFPPLASPDGNFLVYAADRDGDEIFELHSVRTSGEQAPVRLLGPVPEYLLPYPRISLDGSKVLLVVDLDGNGSQELAAVPIDGSGPPTALGGLLEASSSVSWFEQSHDGARVLYASNADSPEAWELFSVPVDGGPPAKLSGSLVPGGNVQLVLPSSAGLALYSADQDADERVELFAVPVDGSAPARKLPIPLVLGGSVAVFRLDPDGTHVFYTADQEEDERYELFSIASDGSQPPRKLNGPLVPGGDVGVLYPPSYPCWPYCVPRFDPTFYLSPDGRWVVYTANQDSLERFELYGAPADGSRPAARLSAESERNVYLSALTPDSAWAIYQTDPSAADQLLSVPVDGSAPARRISAPPTDFGRIYAYPQVSLDSRYAVYQGDQDTDGVLELYSTPVDGSSAPVKLNADLPPGGDVFASLLGFPGFWVLEGGVAYQAEQERAGLEELYLVPVAGGAAPRKLAAGPIEGFLYPSLAYAGSSFSFLDQILFLRRGELYSVDAGTGARPVLLDGLTGRTVGDVEGFELSPDGERVVYQALEEEDVVAELYSVSTSKPQERVQVRPDPRASSPLSSPRLTPDGGRVLFLARRSAEAHAQDSELVSAPTDGSTGPVVLNGPLGPADSVREYWLAPDGQRVVFLALLAGQPALFSASVDGSAAPTLLRAAQRDDVGLGTPQLSAVGGQVAFMEGSRLYAVPLDGSSPALLLSASLPVADYALARDGTLVVFRRGGAGAHELFVVPSDGSQAPRRLSAPLQAGGRITAFGLAPDAAHAVYLADQTTDETFELHGVRVDGSAPPVRLHAALPAGRDVSDFELSSDGRRVVYRADALGDDQLELPSAG